MLRVWLGGTLRLEAAGEALPAPASRRARAVLAYLALHPDPHTRAPLAARFWPDVLDDSARTSLRAALSELRRALGPAADSIVATRDTVALSADVDVRRFEDALRRGDPAAALEACGTPILDDFDDDWAHEARRTHAERLTEALEQLASSIADPAAAVRLTREQVALDPLSEDANRRLIERLARAGDRAAALKAGERFAERLRTALAIAPSRETRALLEELRQTPSVATPAPVVLAREHDAAFVGRAHELALLNAAWGDTQQHASRRIVLIAGEPGVGKTRLAHRFARGVLDGGTRVLVGRCGEEPLAPFEPYAEMLRQLGAAHVLEPGADAGTGARARLFAQVEAALGDRPLLLVIDDLHWADRATLLLTSFLLRSERRQGLLLLGTYRDTELGRHSPLTGALAELQRDGALQRVGLRGLAPEDVAALARALLGDDADAARVHARTDGNAFYAEQVLRGLTENAELPESVRHAVGVRLARLSDDANTAIAAAAVLGLEVDPHVVATMTAPPAGPTADADEARGGAAERADEGRGGAAARADAARGGAAERADEGRDGAAGRAGEGRGGAAGRADADAVAEAALDELLRARLLRPAATPGRVEFAHALVREAVYDELNALRRARLHRRAADALTALGESRHLEEIAHHLFEAGEARRAAELLTRTGRRATEALAYEDAAERFARALEALELAGAPDDAGPVLLARGDALLRAGEPTAARECFTAAARLARRTRDTTLLAEAALGYAGLGVTIVRLDQEVVARLEEALAIATDPALRSRLHARLAVELYYAPARDRSETLSAEAVATAPASALAAALNARHVALWRPDRVEERLRTAGEMIHAARAAQQPHLELQARNWRVVDLFELGDMPACREEIARHARLAEELRLPAFEWYTPLWAGTQAALAGRFAEAERLAAEARAAGERAGDDNAELFAGMVLELIHCQRREHEQTDMAFLLDKVENSPAGPAYQCYLAWTLAGLGRHAEARQELEKWMRHDLAFDANWISAQAEVAQALVLLGDRTHAQRIYDRLAPYAGRPATSGRAVMSYGAIDRHLGELAALLGDTAAAIAHLRAGIDRDAELGCTVWREHGLEALDALTERHVDR
ncbi:AAA family ATPase [Solirubrobacter soli]|uniref:AAA family ATPase n=1 Tax=Solirubrobacter soli TaxID=363832 RepID=UPI0003FF0247|nr:AAA family ATPase [Solirubrobacter soli]